MTMESLQHQVDSIFSKYDELMELYGLRTCPVCQGDKEIHPALQRPEVSFVCPKCNGLGMIKE